jgi:hypothetical protein
MANHNPNWAKVNRNYSFEEVAAVFGVHKNTVAGWVKNGLPCLKDKRPFLILGADIRSYLQRQRSGKKQKCKQDELFCMRCKMPTKPAENFVEYFPSSKTKGCLKGFCSICECIINKFVSYESLEAYSVFFDISKPKDQEHINDSTKPLLNSDFIK